MRYLSGKNVWLLVVLAILLLAGSASAAGDVWTWGRNDYGQLGDGTTTDRYTPVQVSGLANVIAVGAEGGSTTIALKSDGTAWTWGWNGRGQLGDGTTTDRYIPAQVSGHTSITAIVASMFHTVALRADGTVWTWGWNMYGQLGDSTTTDRYTPVQVSGLTNVTAIAAGANHTIALKSDGTVWTWGWNAYGQLGDGTTTNRYTPVQVSGLANVIAIGAGDYHSVAVKSDGTVWTWGWNGYGQLGDGTTTNRYTPVQVSGLTNVTAVSSTGAAQTIALKSDGTVWAWGNNWFGQLGDGTTTQRLTPIQVSGLTNVIAIAEGGFHTVAIKNDRTVWAWGRNNYGQVGDGTTTQRLTPVRVSGLTDIIAVAAGGYHTIALKGPGVIGYSASVAAGQNTFIVATNGSFGTVLKGTSKIINNSVTLNNTGDVNATVDARFNDSVGGVFGLVSGSDVLNASNFALRGPPALNWVALNDDGTDARVATAPAFGSITLLDARLYVPPAQPAGSYSGTVILTFGNEV